MVKLYLLKYFYRTEIGLFKTSLFLHAANWSEQGKYEGERYPTLLIVEFKESTFSHFPTELIHLGKFSIAITHVQFVYTRKKYFPVFSLFCCVEYIIPARYTESSIWYRFTRRSAHNDTFNAHLCLLHPSYKRLK